MTAQRERETTTTQSTEKKTPKKPERDSKNLSDAAPDEVSGGLNPQPLPPGIYNH